MANFALILACDLSGEDFSTFSSSSVNLCKTSCSDDLFSVSSFLLFRIEDLAFPSYYH